MNSQVSRPVLHFAVASAVINLVLWVGGGTYQILSARLVQADEAALSDTLRLLRKSIDQFAADHERAPQALDELVAEGYINEVPSDPMTGSSSTWVMVFEAAPIALDGQRGLVDVVSGSARLDSSGQQRYSQW